MGIWVSNMVGIGGIWVGGIRIGSAGIGDRGSNGRLFGISSLDNGVGNWESIGKTITSIGMTITSISIRISVASVQKSGVSLGISLSLRGSIGSSKQTNNEELHLELF